MPTGQERLVLATCDELAVQEHGFVLASDIAEKTGMALRAVQDCLLGLDGNGYVDLVPLENGDLRAATTPKGRQELVKEAMNVGMPILVGHKERQIKFVPETLLSPDNQTIGENVEIKLPDLVALRSRRSFFRLIVCLILMIFGLFVLILLRLQWGKARETSEQSGSFSGYKVGIPQEIFLSNSICEFAPSPFPISYPDEHRSARDIGAEGRWI